MKKLLFTLIAVFSVYSAFGQETTSVVRGTVSDSSGNAVVNANVQVVSVSTGLSRSVSTNSSGFYNVRNLPAGVAYNIQVSASGLLDASSDGVQLAVGQNAVINFVMSSVEEVKVVGSRLAVVETAIGPNSVFSLADLQNSPAVNRDIKDVIQQDPRIFLEQSRGSVDAIQCNGANSRFNSLTVDGVRLNDGFGLNSNGYPTQRMPFPYDAISSVAVELAPMSVVYGGFSACNINAVTKTGSNELFGSVFFDFGNADFKGDSLEGDEVTGQEFDTTRYGFEVGGAIVEDTLFFYGAYEFLDSADELRRGPIGSGALNEVSVTQAELDEIAQIARDVYNYDPGVVSFQPYPYEDEKYIAKLDWYATDNQRLSYTYLYNDSMNLNGSDRDLNEIEFLPHYYNRGAELITNQVTLYSDWSENFSTEVRVGSSEVDFLQACLQGATFGEMRIELSDVDVFLGCDDARQVNDLDYTVDQVVARGTLEVGDHSITFGYENEALDIYNLFYFHADTEIRFDGIEDFRNGDADRIYYGSHESNDPFQSGDYWGYDVDTMYLEDEFRLNEDVVVTLGLRYEQYNSDDRPMINQDFVSSYGFANDANLDGVSLLMPRIAFTYEYSPNLSIRGGYGLFSGGNPNVWYSNIYSNTNVDRVQDELRGVNLFDLAYSFCEPGVPEGPGWCIPTVMADNIAAREGSNYEMNHLDPDFKAPADRKLTLGLTYDAPNGYVVTVDLMKTTGQDNVKVMRSDLVQVGVGDNGYPEYDSVLEPSFVLTNSSLDNESESMALGVSKNFDNGLDMRLGYAYVDAKEVQPMTSSVAFSNYINRAFFDPQAEELAPANYLTKHRVTGVLNYETNIFGDYSTRFSLFAQANTGAPYSLTNSGFGGTVLAYGFTPYLDFEQNVLLEPGTRNNIEGSSWAKADLRVSQQLPGLDPSHRSSAFVVLENATNFLSDEWGIYRRALFPYGVTQGDYEDGDAEARFGSPSIWEIRFGLDYKF